MTCVIKLFTAVNYSIILKVKNVCLMPCLSQAFAGKVGLSGARYSAPTVRGMLARKH